MPESGKDGDRAEPVNVGSETLPPDMTSRDMARSQGFDTTPTQMSREAYYEKLAEEEAERRSE